MRLVFCKLYSPTETFVWMLCEWSAYYRLIKAWVFTVDVTGENTIYIRVDVNYRLIIDYNKSNNKDIY